jgi:DNA-binding MarR family transcriptional regulator
MIRHDTFPERRREPLPAAPYRLARSPGFMLGQAARQHQGRLDLRLRAHGITWIELKVLLAIGTEGRSQPSDIADHLGMEKPSVSRAIAALEGKGLVVAGKGATDRRGKVLGLSAAGRQAMLAGMEEAGAANVELLSALTEDERARFVELLQRILPGRRDG